MWGCCHFSVAGLQRLTQQWCDASGDGKGQAEEQQQDADHWSCQPSHDEMEVKVTDAVRGIQLWRD